MGEAESPPDLGEVIAAGAHLLAHPVGVVYVRECGQRSHLPEAVHCEVQAHLLDDVECLLRGHRVADSQSGEAVDLGKSPESHHPGK